MIDCQLSRINEALITTVLHLINHPKTRQYVRADVELERILAPYTDFHYRHNPDTAEGQLKEVRAAGLRALRYLIRDSSILQKVLKLKVDYLIARGIQSLILREADG